MSLLVTIRCIKGSLAGKEWRFKDVEEVTIGRMTDNVIVTPEKESMISRHHCIIEINAPLVTVLDFGSKNGTFMNGKLLAKRRSGIPPQEAQKELGDNVLVPSGAVIGVGQTDGTDEIFQVEYREVDAPNEFYNTAFKKLKGFMDEDQKEIEKHRYKGDDHYKIIRKLGNGGFGEAYLAEDKQTKERVVIKTLLSKRRTSDTAKKWFLREAQLSMQLKHPNIVHTYDVTEDDDQYKILMEYCKGGDLETFLEKRGALDIKTATAIMYQLLDALIYTSNVTVDAKLKDGSIVQSKGVVHRDVKPSNILFAGDKIDTLRLADFGISKAYRLAGQSAFTMSKDIRCTFEYSSRTLLRNAKYATPEVDVWAAAAVYYEMLTGKRARDNEKEMDRFVAVLEIDPMPIRKRNAKIPVELANVIDSVLKEEGKKGGTSAIEFKNKIKRALQ